MTEPISLVLPQFTIFFPLQINRASSMSNGSKKAKKREHHHVYDVPLGNMGCRVFKQGVQNWKDFCLKIDISKGNH